MDDEPTIAAPPDLLRSAVEAVDGSPILTLPDIRLFRAIADIKSATEWPDSLRVLAPEATLSEVRREFLTATHVVDLIEEGPLDVRAVPDATAVQPLLVSESGFTSFLGIGEERLCSLRTEEPESADLLGTQVDDLWDEAEDYTLQTPPYSRMLETLGGDVSVETQEDFQAVLESQETTRSIGESLDEVNVALLMAARNGQQLYHLGRWGEEVGLASSAKFSREKRRMEEIGLIETEKVKSGVGRPRQRLVLSEHLEEMPPEDLVVITESVMS